MSDSTTAVLNAESILALLDEDQQPIRLLNALRVEDAYCRSRSSLLLVLNALAHICTTDQIDEAYAAGLYITPHDKGDNLTIMLSGSSPIPAATQENVARVMSLLRAAANNHMLYGTLSTDLFVELTLAGFDKWRRRAYIDDGDVWNRRINGVREKMAGEDASMFEAVVKHLEVLREYAATSRSLKSLDDVRTSVRTELFAAAAALDKMIQEGPVSQNLITVDDGLPGIDILEEFLRFGAPILDGRSKVDDSGGHLREDFSVSYFALGLLGTYRCAAYLSIFVKKRDVYFSGDGPQIEYCSSVPRSVPIDAETVRRTLSAQVSGLSVMRTRSDASATGHMHAVPNLLQHLLLNISRSPGAVLMPVIGTSSLVCAGCDACLKAYEGSPIARVNLGLTPGPVIKLEYIGTSGMFKFPWIAPDLRESYDTLHGYLEQRMEQMLTRSLFALYARRQIRREMRYEARLSALTAEGATVAT